MNINLTKRQREILIGLLLGDGNLSKPSSPNANSRLKVVHGYKQLFYNRWLKKEFKGLNSRIDIYKPSKNTYGKTDMNRMYTHVYEDFTLFYYQAYTPKKTISKNWLQEISPLSLAIWFQDDGNKNTLHTQGFTFKDLKVLQKILRKKFELKFNIKDYKKIGKKLKHVMTLTGSSLIKFNALIKPHMLPKFYYKLYEPKPIKYIKCQFCNKVILNYKNHTKICNSKKCKLQLEKENGVKRRKRNHPSRIKQCVICNKGFHPRTSRILTCSQKCSHRRELNTQKIRRNNVKYANIVDIKIEDSNEKWVYDIEVADNHNYFANNLLVSNSQAISPYKVRQSIFPMGSGVKGGAKIIQAGIPGILGSHFHKAYKNKYDKETNPLGYLHQVYPWEACPRLDVNYITNLRNNDPDSFERNYELLWARSNHGYFITYEEYEACEEDYDPKELYKKALEEGWPMYWGIDFAKLRDSTVLLTLAKNPKNDQFYVVGDIIELRGTEYIDQIGYFKNIYLPGKIMHTCADKSSVGEMPVEALNDGGIRTTGITFNIQSKDKIYKNFRYQIQNKLIHWPKRLPNKEYKRFKQQLLELEIEYKSTGLISVHHNLEDNLARDDFPDAICLAVWAACEYIEPNITLM